MFHLHDPDSKLDYTCDYALWMASSDIISVSTWALTPADGTLSALVIAEDGLSASVSVAGLLRGKDYALTNRITTVAGRIYERTIALRCDQG